MDDKIKKQLDEVVTKVVNPEGKDHVSKSIFKYMDRVEKVINYVLDFQE